MPRGRKKSQTTGRQRGRRKISTTSKRMRLRKGTISIQKGTLYFK